ncbi:MAG: STAS domain-containing protein, partial [Acidimicrobiales bacterium]|nr:STAS domain-containing protein [Acidimicrobiales bacterium]
FGYPTPAHTGEAHYLMSKTESTATLVDEQDTDTVSNMAAESIENQLSITTSAGTDSTVVVVSGEVDAATSDTLRAAIFDVIEGGQTNVVVDMSEVSFIDSSGLRVLIGGYKAADTAGGKLSVGSPSDAVVRLLEITGQFERFTAK